MSTLATFVNYRGHRLEFTSGDFFDCSITFHDKPVGGLFAAAARTTPQEFVSQCKACVDKILAGQQQYNSAARGDR